MPTKSKTFKRSLIFLITLFFFLIIFFAFNRSESALTPENRNYPELEFIKTQSWDFNSLSRYFEDLAQKKGAEYAYEVLKQAEVKEPVDFHLLGHVVGDILYRQKGVDGMKICTQDFRNACSHSIAVGFFSQKGDRAIDEISEVCNQAPGGKDAYKMCFHGLGHGVLAYANYEVPKAIEICKKIPANRKNNSEITGCVGGVIMEIVGGGFHSRELWKLKSDYYLSKNDPLNICLNPAVPNYARSECIVYLTPFLFSVSGVDPENIEPLKLAQAYAICDELPLSEKSLRHSCFGGFGKEFVVIAQYRDIRNIESMNNTQLGRVYNLCALAGKSDAISSCINYAVGSFYWSGENEPDTAIRFCSLTGKFEKNCLVRLTNLVSNYAPGEDKKTEFCAKVPSEFAQDCTKRMKDSPQS